MAALTADADGTPVTEGSNFMDFCAKLTRQSAKGRKRCELCDRDGGLETRRTGKASAYFCHAGLVDFASPITVNGRFIGSFIGGQVLTEEPDDEHFRKIAKELDIDPDTFIEALHKVSIVPKEKVQKAADFMHTLAEILSSMAYTSHSTTRMNAQLMANIDNSANIAHSIQHISERTNQTIKSMGDSINDLTERAQQCLDEVNGCSEAVDLIQENATTTHILGINASIEASRAKEEGKGFGVIAREVRGLADTSKQSADVMKSQINNIREHTQQMSDSAQRTKEIIEQCIGDLEKLKEEISQLTA